MIFDEIKDLKQYIISEVKVNCDFGDPDLASDQYPFIKIMMIDDFDMFVGNTKLSTLDLPLLLKIVVDDKNEMKALGVMDRLFNKINQFNSHKGHELGDSGIPEYIDESSTYEVTIPYKLKLIFQDTA